MAAAGQLVVTVFAFAYAAGSPLVTRVTASWPRRPLLIGSLVGCALANLPSAASPGMAMLAATRVVDALCAGLFVPGATAAALVPPEGRGRALAVLGGTLLATVLGVPIGLWVAGLGGWRAATRVLAVFILDPLLLAWWATQPATRRMAAAAASVLPWASRSRASPGCGW